MTVQKNENTTFLQHTGLSTDILQFALLSQLAHLAQVVQALLWECGSFRTESTPCTISQDTKLCVKAGKVSNQPLKRAGGGRRAERNPYDPPKKKKNTTEPRRRAADGLGIATHALY